MSSDVVFQIACVRPSRLVRARKLSRKVEKRLCKRETLSCAVFDAISGINKLAGYTTPVVDSRVDLTANEKLAYDRIRRVL